MIVYSLQIIFMLYLFYLVLSLVAVVLFVVVLARAFNDWRSLICVGLYTEALRDENTGHFEAAVTAYETALFECKKIRFQGDFRNKIIAKVKLLHTIIEYNNSSRFVR